MKSEKIINKDFLLIVIGQIISLFGNGILRFVLPLYLLQITNSPIIFGLVSAISFLPLILIMPLGGIIADRVNKRNVMIILDFLTAFLMIIFFITLNKIDTSILILITMMTLYSISGLYQPTIQASLPLILNKDILVNGNSIVSSISALSNLLCPIIAGFLFGIYGIIPLVIISIICFFISAILEMFIIIPYKKINENKSIFNIVKKDIIISINFIFKEKVILSKIILVACILNAFISSLIIISLPILITERLKYSSEIYGISTGIMAFGSLIGGIITGILKPTIEKSYKYFLMLVFTLLPLFVGVTFINIKLLSLILILISVFFIMIISTIISIIIMTYVQNNTDENIVGKVMSFLLTLSICSQPIGQAFYGFIFEYLKGYESIVILIAIFISILTSIYVKLIFNINSK